MQHWALAECLLYHPLVGQASSLSQRLEADATGNDNKIRAGAEAASLYCARLNSGSLLTWGKV
jgi:hypothetical protein